MKSAAIFLNSGARILALALGALLLTSCAGTVTPRQVIDHQASFDGNDQNSGFIGWSPAGQGILTAHGRDRYNALIDLYGKDFHPPLKPDEGITLAGGQVLIDAQHLEYFVEMQRRYRARAR